MGEALNEGEDLLRAKSSCSRLGSEKLSFSDTVAPATEKVKSEGVLPVLQEELEASVEQMEDLWLSE